MSYPHSVPVDLDDVQQAFIDGCREARKNPSADEATFERGADAYVKLLIERKHSETSRGGDVASTSP